jgi:adenine-specific DNA-methyltransferase
MPELTWIGKEKVINHHLDVPFKILEKKYNYPQDLTGLNIGLNKIIHGDNLEALKALLPEYENQVKCIYIDPPYNTGNENWVYNDNVNDEKIRKWLGKVVGKEDLNRSDRWLCMMYPRLVLLRKLLAQDGAIFISIDDNEQAHLKFICDKIFGQQNFVTSIVWQRAYAPVSLNKYFSTNHDFILVYAKSINDFTINKLERTEEQKRDYKNPDNDPRGLWKVGNPSVGPAIEKNVYEMILPSGRIVLPPKGRSWLYSKEKFEELKQNNRIWFGKDGNSIGSPKLFLSEVNQGITPMTTWLYEEVGHTQDAKKEIKDIFPESEIPFETPKPTKLIERILQLSTDKNSIVLDSFAGSGTTAHAVLNLNKQDGGNRKFILIECKDYAESLTAERVKRVIEREREEKNQTLIKFDSLEGALERNIGFSFYELGEPLLDENNDINPQASTEAIRKYIWYTETANVNPVLSENGYLLGIEAQTAYYFYYEKAAITTLDIDFLATVPAEMAGMSFVIYADMCLLSQAFLEKNRIIFKKIPRDISKL